MRPTIDFAGFERLMAQTGLSLTTDQLRGIFEGYAGLQAMLARVRTPMPREVEPALTFDPENV